MSKKCLTKIVKKLYNVFNNILGVFVEEIEKIKKNKKFLKIF